jgi:hypothetical protein
MSCSSVPRSPLFSKMSIPVIKRLTSEEGRARVRVTSDAPSRPPLAPPQGKGGPDWQVFYATAVAQGHPEPEKLADSLLRARERALALKDARPAVKVITKIPGAPPKEERKGGRPMVEATRCRAKTLEGRQCGFKATCGGFCKKHFVSTV